MPREAANSTAEPLHERLVYDPDIIFMFFNKVIIVRAHEACIVTLHTEHYLGRYPHWKSHLHSQQHASLAFTAHADDYCSELFYALCSSAGVRARLRRACQVAQTQHPRARLFRWSGGRISLAL